MTSILLLAGWYYPDSLGGTERYVRLLAMDLQSLGYDVTVAAPSTSNEEREYTLDGIPIFRYPIDPHPSRDQVSGRVEPRYFDRFLAFLDRTRPDVVHLHSVTGGCGYFHARAVKKAGIPFVFTLHMPDLTCARGTMMQWGAEPCDGVMQHVPCAACVLHARGVPRMLAWPVATLANAVLARGRVASALGGDVRPRHERTREFLELPDRIVVVAQWMRDLLLRNGVGEGRLFLSRHGLANNTTSQPGSPDRSMGQLRVGYVGRLAYVKGVDLLVRAVRSAPAAQPVSLHIYGSARSAEEVAFRASLLELAEGDPRIIFHPEFQPDDIESVLRGIDVLAVPSRWMEAGPLVALEALACGVPVAGPAYGGLAELILPDENGILLRKNTVDEWVGVIGEMLNRRSESRWNWRFAPVRRSPDVAAEMSRLYEEILREKRAEMGDARPGTGDRVSP